MGHGHHPGKGKGHCGCGRHFLSREEKVEKMKQYREWLVKETKGVDEAIAELEKGA